MTRTLILMASAALVVAQTLGAAQASTITYDLVLNNTAGPENGTGSFTVNGPIASNGLDIFTVGSGLTSLNFLIDNTSFTLGNALPGADVVFFNGDLINIAYAGFVNGVNLSLGTLGLGYAFNDLSQLRLDSVGTISGSQVSATPLPATWTMMLIGLIGFGLMLVRRKRHDTVPNIAAA